MFQPKQKKGEIEFKYREQIIFPVSVVGRVGQSERLQCNLACVEEIFIPLSTPFPGETPAQSAPEYSQHLMQPPPPLSRILKIYIYIFPLQTEISRFQNITNSQDASLQLYLLVLLLASNLNFVCLKLMEFCLNFSVGLITPLLMLVIRNLVLLHKVKSKEAM